MEKKNLGLERKSVHELAEVLPFVIMKSGRVYRDFAGDRMKMNSARYQVFVSQGLKCVTCGIEGQFFAKERVQGKNESYHFNLYALDENQEEVLMTKDHIIPKSKGGTNTLDNYQPMCFICNHRKGNGDGQEEKA